MAAAVEAALEVVVGEASVVVVEEALVVPLVTVVGRVVEKEVAR